MDSKSLRVFVSYSWDDDAHKKWVKDFTDSLIECGFDAVLDQYDASLGDRLPHFMEQSISESDYVLIICTPSYKEKADNRRGGVGYEGHIISAELMNTNNERKFIPVLRKGSFSTAIPTFLAGKLAEDLSEKAGYQERFEHLVTALWGGKRKPNIGKKPEYVVQANPFIGKSDEPVHIIGIVTEDISRPKLDGTRGSALYSIPFKLSKIPSREWVTLFIHEWNYPRRFSTMHRPGIASVHGDTILLDGTTLEEVSNYHKDTLILCVDEANRKEAELLAQRSRAQEQENEQIKQFSDHLSALADEIDFLN